MLVNDFNLSYCGRGFDSRRLHHFGQKMNLQIKTLQRETPLIHISKNIYGKLETYSPTGSVKDRMVFYVLQKAIDQGLINKDTILCEATSVNTGISLSAAAASMGLKCVIFMPSNMSQERKEMMWVYGSELRFSSPTDFIEAIAMRDEFMKNNKNSWSPMQFSNPANIECHQKITALEIDMETFADGWGAFVHGAGTGGTMMGIKQYIDQNKLSTKTFLVVPAENNHGIQGINDGADFLLDKSLMDGIITITTENAIARATQFAEETGILIGISSGANLIASEIVSKTVQDRYIVTMLCDRGERYMSIY